MKGLFISFEGIDGGGKSTAVEWFFEQLKATGIKVMRTREPGGTPLAERVRELVLWGIPQLEEDFPKWAEVCLFNASRATHLQNLILPRMEQGYTIITDRFCDSTFAHQGGGHGLDVEKLKQLHAIVNDNVKPDITFLFDGDPLLFKQRMLDDGRTPDRLEKHPIEFQYRSRDVHLACMAEEPERYVLIDATQPFEAVKAQLMPHMMEIVNRVRARVTL